MRIRTFGLLVCAVALLPRGIASQELSVPPGPTGTQGTIEAQASAALTGASGPGTSLVFVDANGVALGTVALLFGLDPFNFRQMQILVDDRGLLWNIVEDGPNKSEIGAILRTNPFYSGSGCTGTVYLVPPGLGGAFAGLLKPRWATSVFGVNGFFVRGDQQRFTVVHLLSRLDPLSGCVDSDFSLEALKLDEMTPVSPLIRYPATPIRVERR